MTRKNKGFQEILEELCGRCHGTGQIVKNNLGSIFCKCPDCKGSGVISYKFGKCARCKGSGRLPKKIRSKREKR